MGKVIHIDGAGAGGGGTGTGYIGIFTNYNDLIAQFPTAPLLSLAYVENSQGTPWLPGSMLGTFYSKGTYIWNGIEWSSDVDEIAKALEDINNEIAALGLPEILTVDNTTLDGQTIEALNGIGVLDLRDGINDSVKLIGANAGILISGSLGVISFTNNADNLNDLTSSVTNSNFGTSLVLENKNVLIDKTGLVGLVYNQDFNWNFDKDLPNFPSQLSTQLGNYIQGVVNSVSLGGKYTIVKTNETAYINQLGFNKGEAFELILENFTPTADRLQAFQNADGIIALLSDLVHSTAFLVYENGVPNTALTQNVWNYFDMLTATLEPNTLFEFEQLAGFPETLVYKGTDTKVVRIVSTTGLRRIGGGINSYQMRWVLNGVQIGGSKQFELGGTDSEVTLTVLVELAFDDQIWLEVRNITNNNDVRLLSANITVK